MHAFLNICTYIYVKINIYLVVIILFSLIVFIKTTINISKIKLLLYYYIELESALMFSIIRFLQKVFTEPLQSLGGT